MDYYFTATSEQEALRAKNIPGGPAPQNQIFNSVEAKGIMATALEELVANFSGKDNAYVMAKTLPLWPKMPENPEDYEPGSAIFRLPDSLRNELTEIDMTYAVIAEFARELLGYSHEEAKEALQAIILLACNGRKTDSSLYWWSEM